MRQRNDNLKMTRCFVQENDNHGPHSHLSVEVTYLEEGELFILTAGSRIPIRAGQMIVIPSYTTHSFSTPDYARTIVAVIPMDFVPAIHRRLQSQSFSKILIEEPAPDLVGLIRLLLESCERGSRETVQGLSQALLGLLLDRYGTSQLSAHAANGTIQQVVEYMRQHFTEDITLSDLSLQFGYSASHLAHLIRDQLHMTFTDYLNVLRCRQAAMAILSGEKNVLDAAETAGFHSVSTFYRVFRKIYQTTPLEYAQKNSKNRTLEEG